MMRGFQTPALMDKRKTTAKKAHAPVISAKRPVSYAHPTSIARNRIMASFFNTPVGSVPQKTAVLIPRNVINLKPAASPVCLYTTPSEAARAVVLANTVKQPTILAFVQSMPKPPDRSSLHDLIDERLKRITNTEKIADGTNWMEQDVWNPCKQLLNTYLPGNVLTNYCGVTDSWKLFAPGKAELLDHLELSGDKDLVGFYCDWLDVASALRMMLLASSDPIHKERGGYIQNLVELFKEYRDFSLQSTKPVERIAQTSRAQKMFERAEKMVLKLDDQDWDGYTPEYLISVAIYRFLKLLYQPHRIPITQKDLDACSGKCGWFARESDWEAVQTRTVTGSASAVGAVGAAAAITVAGEGGGAGGAGGTAGAR